MTVGEGYVYLLTFGDHCIVGNNIIALRGFCTLKCPNSIVFNMKIFL